MKGTPTSQSSVSVVSLAELAEAIRHQTMAINRMADSNWALVYAMTEGDGIEDEPDCTTYLDGTSY